MGCSRCHRPLTDPESIELGIGPICRAKKAAELSGGAGEDSGDSYDLPFDPKTKNISWRRSDRGMSWNIPHIIKQHSPTGFGVGYMDRSGIKPTVQQHYQFFKVDFLAGADRDGGTIEGDQIRAWLKERGVAEGIIL